MSARAGGYVMDRFLTGVRPQVCGRKRVKEKSGRKREWILLSI